MQAQSKTISVDKLKSELLDGSLLSNCKEAFPKVPWGPPELVKVLLGTAATAAVTQVATSTILLTPLAADDIRLSTSVDMPGSRVEAPVVSNAARSYTDPGGGAPDLSGMRVPSTRGPETFPEIRANERALALKHAATEACLLAGTAAILWGGLRSSQPRSAGAFSYTLTRDWAVVTAAVCCVVFPLADPVISQAWAALLKQVGGATDNASGGALVEQLSSCSRSGDVLSIGLHGVASAALGPIWEETFWRGFFLTSLTRVLPLPACVAISSLGFAVLHLTPVNLLPILLLAPCGDLLFLRSASLAPPILLHAAWNGYQLLAIAVGGKDYFV